MLRYGLVYYGISYANNALYLFATDAEILGYDVEHEFDDSVGHWVSYGGIGQRSHQDGSDEMPTYDANLG